ncbi:uncharacterized protein VNE69_04138 [Vairimorpha necatrix]|uniref:Uncharacterized protein n=1 Tax=Vairimorpha necatrix TaxID=6039 RepID=A0AAX4JBE8_9MICR
MKLVIDKYEIPGNIISEQIFRTKEVQDISNVHDLDPHVVYCIHEESPDLRKIKWYFNEIVEIRNNLVYINKKRKIVKYYNIIRERGEIIFKEIKNDIKIENKINKNDFLPHLEAQNDEVVIFPNEEEDEEI